MAAKRTRVVLAFAGALSLLALAWLATVPHSWHKQDGPRACTVCQAFRTPSTGAEAPVELEAPWATCWRQSVHAAFAAPSALIIVRHSRSPPF